MTSWRRRNLLLRNVLLSRQRRSASSQKQTLRCPRAHCSSRRTRRRRRKNSVRSRSGRSASRNSDLLCLRRSTWFKRKMGLCDSSCARLGNYSARGTFEISFSFCLFWQVGGLCRTVVFCCFCCFAHFVYLQLYSFLFFQYGLLCEHIFCV